MAMKEATLPRSFAYGRKIYTPEDTEIPEGLYDYLVEQGVLEEDGDPTEAETETGLFAGLSEEQVKNLTEAGFGEADAIASATVAQLQAVEKVGQNTAKILKARAS